MLEMCNNQAAGLRSMLAKAAPRVMAMASHGNQQGELPLLWSLCSTLVGLGYPVAVLDATTAESADNPGLEHLLDDAYSKDGDDCDPLSWTVIPAAHGLQRLCSQPSSDHGLAVDPLAGLFPSFGVIVIYAGTEILTRLLPGSGIAPLLTVTPAKASSVTAYQALKKMLLNAQLRPTVANITSKPLSTSSLADQSPIKKLQECAMTFLDYQFDSLAIRVLQSQKCRSDDMNRLAWRLLENALPLQRHHFEGSH